MRRRVPIGAALAVAGIVLVGCTSLVPGSATPAPGGAAVPTQDTATGDVVDCVFGEAPERENDPARPPDAAVPSAGSVEIELVLGQGALGLTLDRSGAPCAAAALSSLADQGWFDDSPCHRLTTSASLEVLQCGDPSGTGTGGPGYSYPTDTDGSETYPRGTVAMANSGQGFDGSQFFLVWGRAELPADYTVVGTVDDAGLAVLDDIAAAGVMDGSDDGPPAAPVTIQTATVGS